MSVEVVIPEVGEVGMEVTFVRWLHAEGDAVREGEPLFELDTAKAIMEVDAFASGRLADLRVKAGDLVQPHQVVAIIQDGEDVAAKPSTALLRHASTEAASIAAAIGPPPAPPEVAPAATPISAASPRARRVATQHGVDLVALRGTGPGGLISERDVLDHVAAGRSAAPSRTGTAVPSQLTVATERVREVVARRTLESWQTIPHFSLRLVADVTDGLAGQRPTAFVARAAVDALRAHPECNLRWDGSRLVGRDTIDLGILVDTPSGLLLPAVRRAGNMGHDELEAAIQAAAERARSGQLEPDDAGSHSLTLSNLGMFAVDEFSGIIPTGDVLLLAFGRLRPAAAWEDGKLVRRETLTLTLVIDHRALSGADGARLLTTLERELARPRPETG